MKKTMLGLMVILMVMPVALAADESNTILPIEPGLTPDSPFYFMDGLGETLQLTFAFNVQDKAQLRLDLAEERLAELDTLVKQNKFEYQNQLMTAYNNQLRFMENDIIKAEAEGQNMEQVRATVKTRTLAHSNVMGDIESALPLEYQNQFKNSVNLASEAQEQIGNKAQEDSCLSDSLCTDNSPTDSSDNTQNGNNR